MNPCENESTEVTEIMFRVASHSYPTLWRSYQIVMEKFQILFR